MTELTPNDLKFVASRIPKDVRDLMDEATIYLAGGFIRSTITGERVSDIDLFGSDIDVLDRIATKLALDRKGRLHKTKNAITVLAPPRHPVQFVTRWLYKDPARLVEEFDFTVARACIWRTHDGWASRCDPMFYPDLAARRLTYCYPIRAEDSGGSLLRVRKFLARGYTIQAESLAGVIVRLMEGIDINHAEHCEAGLQGVIMGKLREVDPLVVVDGFDVVDEHQVTEERNSTQPKGLDQ